MADEKDPWAALADSLGAAPKEQAERHPQPASPPPAPPRRDEAKRKPPAGSPASSDWGTIASHLGLEPVREQPPARPAAPPRPAQPERAPAAQTPEMRADRPAPPRPERGGQRENQGPARGSEGEGERRLPPASQSFSDAPPRHDAQPRGDAPPRHDAPPRSERSPGDPEGQPVANREGGEAASSSSREEGRSGGGRRRRGRRGGRGRGGRDGRDEGRRGDGVAGPRPEQPEGESAERGPGAPHPDALSADREFRSDFGAGSEPSQGSRPRDSQPRSDGRGRGQRRPLPPTERTGGDEESRLPEQRVGGESGGESGGERAGEAGERPPAGAEGEPRRRRGRRGGRRRKSASRDRLREERLSTERDPNDHGLNGSGPGDRSVDDLHDDEPLPGGYGRSTPPRTPEEERAAPTPRGEGNESRDAAGRPRRRRGRGGDRREGSGGGAATPRQSSGEAGGAAPAARDGEPRDGAQRRRRRPERRGRRSDPATETRSSSSLSRGRSDDFAPVAGGRDEDDEGLDFLGIEDAAQKRPSRRDTRHSEEDDILAESGLSSVLDVPSWVEAIGIVIAGNLDARSRPPRADDNDRGRGGRGGR